MQSKVKSNKIQLNKTDQSLNQKELNVSILPSKPVAAKAVLVSNNKKEASKSVIFSDISIRKTRQEEKELGSWNGFSV